MEVLRRTLTVSYLLFSSPRPSLKRHTHTSYMRTDKFLAVWGLLWLLLLMFCCLCPAVSTQKVFFRSWTRPVNCGCLGHAHCISDDVTTFVWSYICRANTMVWSVGLACLWVWVCVLSTTTSLSGMKQSRKYPINCFYQAQPICIERVNCFLGYWTEFASPLEECALSRQEEIRSYQNYLKRLF